MKYELKHFGYSPTKGGQFAKDKNQLRKELNYLGEFSEYNPVGMQSLFRPGNIMTAVIKKIWSITNKKKLKPIKLKDYMVKSSYNSYCSTEFGFNGGMKFTKKDLEFLASTMDDEDELHIMCPSTLDKDRFREDMIKTV